MKHFSLYRWVKYRWKEPYWVNKKAQHNFLNHKINYIIFSYIYDLVHGEESGFKVYLIITSDIQLCLFTWTPCGWSHMSPRIIRDFRLLFFGLASCHLNHIHATHKFKMKWLLLFIRNVLEGKSNVLCFR